MRPSLITRASYRLTRHTSGTPPPAPLPTRLTRNDARVCDSTCRMCANSSPAPQLVVERVALHRYAPGLTHEAHELVDLLLGLGARTRRVKDLLPHDRALHVVRAEVQRDARHRHPHHDPVGLDVRHVVEQQAGD